MLHYVKDNEKLQGCPRCLTEWCNKDPKSALETQVAVQALHSMQQEKGKAERIRSHNYNFLNLSKYGVHVAVLPIGTTRLPSQQML